MIQKLNKDMMKALKRLIMEITWLGKQKRDQDTLSAVAHLLKDGRALSSAQAALTYAEAAEAELTGVHIPNPMPMSFWLAEVEDARVRAIWKDRLSRTIWMGIKYQHLTSQHFNEDVLRLARAIRKRKPETPEDLKRLAYTVVVARGDTMATVAIEWWEALWPFITGQDGLGWKYVPKEDKE